MIFPQDLDFLITAIWCFLIFVFFYGCLIRSHSLLGFLRCLSWMVIYYFAFRWFGLWDIVGFENFFPKFKQIYFLCLYGGFLGLSPCFVCRNPYRKLIFVLWGTIFLVCFISTPDGVLIITNLINWDISFLEEITMILWFLAGLSCCPTNMHGSNGKGSGG